MYIHEPVCLQVQWIKKEAMNLKESREGTWEVPGGRIGMKKLHN